MTVVVALSSSMMLPAAVRSQSLAGPAVRVELPLPPESELARRGSYVAPSGVIVWPPAAGRRDRFGWPLDALMNWYGKLPVDTRDVVKASLGPTVAILLFVFTTMLQGLFTWRARRDEIWRILTGLRDEIALNIKNQEILQATLPDTIEGIKQSLREDHAAAVAAKIAPTYRPVLGITESLQFYTAVASSTPLIKTNVLQPILAYYRSVNDQRVLVGTVESDAFLRITIDSRCATIDELQASFNASFDEGRRAVEAIGRWRRARRAGALLYFLMMLMMLIAVML